MACAKATPPVVSVADYQLDKQVGYILRLASQRHAAVFQKRIPHKLTPTQFSALIRLAQVGECSQNQLGRLAAMDVATIKGVVDRLRKKGLVDVTADASDRRRMLISLTAAAREMIPELGLAGFDISRETLSPLSANEQQQLLRLLDKLV